MPSPINLVTDREDYHHVRMAPDASYGFPTEEAALRFACAHKQIAAERGIDREIQVWSPDGSARPIELGLVTNPETDEKLSMFGPIREARCLNLTATGSEPPGSRTSE